MNKRLLGTTGLSISPLVFGSNVFGWTVDERQGFALLDRFVAHGFDAIDAGRCLLVLGAGQHGRRIGNHDRQLAQGAPLASATGSSSSPRSVPTLAGRVGREAEHAEHAIWAPTIR
jgi:hypothetical protein